MGPHTGSLSREPRLREGGAGTREGGRTGGRVPVMAELAVWEGGRKEVRERNGKS